MTETQTANTDTQTTMTADLASLVTKTVFLKLNFSRFGVMRKCAVEVKSEATESRFSHQKKLLVSPELKAIQKSDAEVRARISALALPHPDIAMHVVPHGMLTRVYKILGDYKVFRPSLVEAFLSVYDQQISDAKTELMEYFNELDYPSREEMRAEFDFNYKIVDFGVPGSLKSFSPEIWAAETEKAHADVVEAAKLISDALASTAHGLVAKLADMLSDKDDGKKKKIYGVHVEKLQEFLNNFDLRNVTDSKELAAEMDKLKALTVGVDVEKIKHNDGLRLELQSQFKDAAASIGALVQAKGRLFRKPDVE